ncbi:MAG: T9SS type A sorting domain-containing protein [Flavobacteriales bacterium]|nr:T9SS type A sorting domain-containing protein [Flavobacteriales bacterium]
MHGALTALASLLFLGRAPAQTYCAGSAGAIYPICSITLSDLNLTSISSGTGYVDLTTSTAHMDAGSSYTLNVNGNTSGYPFNISAYFDWDDDGTWETSVNLGTLTSGCSGAGVSGAVNVPLAATPGTSQVRVVCDYYGPVGACGTVSYGHVVDFAAAVILPTCFAPSAPGTTAVAANSADFSWTASVSNPSNGYIWEVRSSGAPGSGPTGLAASGTAAGLTASATALSTFTAYTFYVRADCGGGDMSSWVPLAFTTSMGCGSTWVSPGGYNTLTDQRFIQTHTVCPSTPGDVVTLDFTYWGGFTWNGGALQRSAMFIFDGDDITDPMITGTGTGYTETGWTVPAGGWVSEPPIITSSHASGCLTVKVFSYGLWTGSPYGWSADFTCAPAPTCFAPTARTVTSTTVHDASFSWNPGASPNVEYKVVAFGGAPGDAAITTGTSASGTATTAAALAANTKYTVYFRGLCDDQGVGDDPSAWSSPALNFRTKPGCGGPYDLFNSNAYALYNPVPVGGWDSVAVICPDNVGDVVTLTIPKFSFGTGNSEAVGVFVHDGNSIAAPIFNSGMPAVTYGLNTLPAGAFRGTTYRNTPGNPGTSPGPFTSTAANGCLTLNFKAFNYNFYDQGMQSNVTCGPAPACSTPNNITISNIGGNSATVIWGNAGNSSVVEYGPAGFTPGTGATAGVNGVIFGTFPSGPVTITGLTALTTYDVYVRQICAGPTYSTNSFRTRFSTSMDCSTAQVISCNEYVSDDNAPAPYLNGSAVYENTTYTSAQSCLGGSAAANGPERLYRFTASEAGTHAIIAGVSDMGTSNIGYVVTSVANGCAASAFTCIGTAAANVGGIITFNVPAAGDYYIMSDANYTVHKRPFTLGCPGIPGCVGAPTAPANGTTLAVNTNPIAFSWPAVFGATSYDVYFQGNLVANTPNTSISSPSYTTAAVMALVGLGQPASWRVVPKNSYGTASCPTDWTFRVGGNGATNAIPLSDGVAYAGNQFSANGYSSLESNYWGNDAWYKFTASQCADSATVSLCLPAAYPSTYFGLMIRRASDNVVLFPPTDQPTYNAQVTSGACFQYSWFNYDPQVWNWVYETPKFEVAAGETYYVIVDGYNYGTNFTIAYNEVLQTTDLDSDGLLDCVDSCPETPGEEGGPCYAGPLFTSGAITGCECVGSGPVPCSNDLTLEFQTDGNPWETTWELVEQGTDFVVQQGGPLNPQNSVETNFTCLPDGCFYLRVLDAAGDGMTTGGYILRTTGAGERIIDNRNNFSTGSTSQIMGGQGFCLPLGTDKMIYSSCDKLDWVNNKFIVCHANAAVTAQYGVTNTTSGYEFWFYDPNGSYSFRRFRSHATSDGYGSGANRACHFKVNGWVHSVATPHLPANTLLNVRVRGRVAGNNLEFGPACQFKIDAILAACPRVSLQDNPANTSDFSCGVSRTFGGASSANNRIYANPPQPVPAVASSNVRYQFRFRIPGEGVCIVRPPQTSARMVLNWTTGTPLVCSKTYDVDVRVSLDGGATWCFGPATSDEASACADTEDWGKVCLVTITCDNNGVDGGSNSMSLEGEGALTMYPNPNHGDQLLVSLSHVAEGVRTVSMDILDLTGKRVSTRTIAVQDGFVKTSLDLNGELASGLYMVNITAGDKTYTERLVIQP